MHTPPSRGRRALTTAAAAVIVSFGLSGCFALPGGPRPVEFDDVQSATIQIEAQGTFVDPGTTAASESAGRGSGFIIDPSGIAITNNHVVVGAGTLKVWVGGAADGKQLSATLLGASECLDLAVIKLEGGPYPFMGWHDGSIKNALDVYSAGFPLGDPEFTLTKGIVSKADVERDFSWAAIDHVIEHDARIRGGNSGGPLVTEDGRVVGVNYAGWDELDYNYAIHRDAVRPVIADLKAGKPVLSLGINADALAPSDDGSPQGVWVSSVQAGGPADKAGIEAGDLIVDMAGITLATDGTLAEYCEVLQTQGVKATIDVTVYRPGSDELWEGQFNGKELELAQSNVYGGSGDGSEPIGSFVTVSDDTGAVSVKAPDTWADTDGSTYTDDQGNEWFDITASPDIQGFYDRWEVPGLSVAASKDLVGTDPETYLKNLTSLIEACTLTGDDRYNDGYYTGHYLYLSDCGGTGTDYVAIAAIDTANTHFIRVQVQMVSEIDKSSVLDAVLQSFQASF